MFGYQVNINLPSFLWMISRQYIEAWYFGLWWSLEQLEFPCRLLGIQHQWRPDTPRTNSRCLPASKSQWRKCNYNVYEQWLNEFISYNSSYLKSDPVGVNDSNVHVIIHVMYMNKELRWNRIPPCPVVTYYW